MPKLKLEIEELNVESFATDGAQAARGTIAGHIVSFLCESGTCFDLDCQSQNQTYLESCVPNHCPNSYDQQCETFGGIAGCYYPVQPPKRL